MVRGALVAVALAVALGAGTALAGEDAPGIWTYDCWMSYTVVNLTNYPLKISTYTVTRDANCRGEAGCSNPLKDLAVDPYRTWKQECDNANLAMPCHWDGAATIQPQVRGTSNTLKDWAFNVSFKSQNAHNLAEHGTWIYLTPASSSWTTPTADAFKYNRWATTINDNKMHNIMTLIGPKVMVAMYSPDNKNIVVVVQQYWENAAGWDDSNSYLGWQLDWVDNDGSTVPR